MTAHSLDLHARQPVRRDSFDIDDPRASVARPIQDGMRFFGAIEEMIHELSDRLKTKGKEHELGYSCIRVLRALRRCTDFKTGVCEPSIDKLMEFSRLARATVVRALKTLWRHGCIDWVRRTEKTGNAPGEGPQVRQVSNAYFFDLARMPRRCLARVRELFNKGGKKFVKPEAIDFPRFEGLRKRRAGQIRDRVAYDRTVKRNALAHARTDEERVAILYPGDEQAQKQHLAMLQGASSADSLNPPPSRSIQKE